MDSRLFLLVFPMIFSGPFSTATFAADNQSREALFCNVSSAKPTPDDTHRCGERPYEGNMVVLGDTGEVRADGDPKVICAWELKPGECWKGDGVSGTMSLADIYKAPNGTSFDCRYTCVLTDKTTLAGRWEWKFGCEYGGSGTRGKMFCSLFYKADSYGWMDTDHFHDLMGKDRPILWCDENGKVMEKEDPLVPGKTAQLSRDLSFDTRSEVLGSFDSETAEGVIDEALQCEATDDRLF